MRQRRANWAWFLYAAFIVYGATIPFHFAGDWNAVAEKLRQLPLSPFMSPDTGRRLSIPDLVQNILFFLPFGALGIAAGRKPRKARWWRVGLITVMGAMLSTTVEALQLITSDRVGSLADIVSNTAGAFLGAVVAREVAGLVSTGAHRLRQEGLADVAELRPLVAALCAIVVAAWQPFDITLEVGTVVGKIRSLERDVWQFNVLRDEGMSLLLAVLFAMALSSYLSALGEARAGRKATALGIVLVCGLEAIQVLIGSRTPGLWDAGVSSAGIAMGAAVWPVATRLPWPGLWFSALVLGTATAAALQMWSPFQVADEYRGFGWFPFLGYYTRTTFETLSHVIELMLLYFPLGFCVAFWPGRRPVLGTVLVAVLMIAVPIEYGQGWVVGRYPDISDVGVSLAGAWFGVLAGRTKA